MSCIRMRSIVPSSWSARARQFNSPWRSATCRARLKWASAASWFTRKERPHAGPRSVCPVRPVGCATRERWHRHHQTPWPSSFRPSSRRRPPSTSQRGARQAVVDQGRRHPAHFPKLRKGKRLPIPVGSPSAHSIASFWRWSWRPTSTGCRSARSTTCSTPWHGGGHLQGRGQPHPQGARRHPQALPEEAARPQPLPPTAS